MKYKKRKYKKNKGKIMMRRHKIMKYKKIKYKKNKGKIIEWKETKLNKPALQQWVTARGSYGAGNPHNLISRHN